MAVLWLHELVNSRIICLTRLRLNTCYLKEVRYFLKMCFKLRYLWDVPDKKIDISVIIHGSTLFTTSKNVVKLYIEPVTLTCKCSGE